MQDNSLHHFAVKGSYKDVSDPESIRVRPITSGIVTVQNLGATPLGEWPDNDGEELLVTLPELGGQFIAERERGRSGKALFTTAVLHQAEDVDVDIEEGTLEISEKTEPIKIKTAQMKSTIKAQFGAEIRIDMIISYDDTTIGRPYQRPRFQNMAPRSLDTEAREIEDESDDDYF